MEPTALVKVTPAAAKALHEHAGFTVEPGDVEVSAGLVAAVAVAVEANTNANVAQSLGALAAKLPALPHEVADAREALYAPLEAVVESLVLAAVVPLTAEIAADLGIPLPEVPPAPSILGDTAAHVVAHVTQKAGVEPPALVGADPIPVEVDGHQFTVSDHQAMELNRGALLLFITPEGERAVLKLSRTTQGKASTYLEGFWAHHPSTRNRMAAEKVAPTAIYQVLTPAP